MAISSHDFIHKLHDFHRYGAGYHMVIVKEPNCVSLHVEELIHSLVPSAKKITDVGAELSFMLPSSAAAQFPELFDSLDGLFSYSQYTFTVIIILTQLIRLTLAYPVLVFP